MEGLNYKRGAVRAKITRFLTWLDESSSNINLNQLKTRRQGLESLLNEYDVIQTEIEQTTNTVDDKEREAFEAYYYGALSRADAILDNSISQPSNHNNSPNIPYPEVKLPAVNIPTFNSGSLQDWNNFYDLFQSLIDQNSSLTNIQKLHYLKSAIKGDGYQIIASLETTDSNYPVALELLKRRFENKKLTTLSHVKSLFDIQDASKSSYTQLRKLVDTFQTHISALEAKGHTDTQVKDLLLVFLLSSKLDKGTLKEWETKAADKDTLPTYNEFSDFLQRRCNVLECLERKSDQTQTSPAAQNKAPHNKQDVQRYGSQNIHASHLVTQAKGSNHQNCWFCDKAHRFYACEKFLAMTVQQRIDETKRLKLCINCLASNHMSSRCQSSSCKVCSKKHNTLLHLDNTKTHKEAIGDENGVQAGNEGTSSDKQSATLDNIRVSHSGVAETMQQGVSLSHTEASRERLYTNPLQILLTTAVVNVIDENGKYTPCRLLLDSGSQCNFITKQFCDSHNFQTQSEGLTIKGINNANTYVNQSATITIYSRFNSFKTTLKFIVLPKITENLPLASIIMEDIQIPHNINLADPDFTNSKAVDMLIGAELHAEIFCNGNIKLHKNGPFIQNTKLGWVVSGKIPTPFQSHQVSVCNLTTKEDLHEQLKGFWEIEEISQKPLITKEEQDCELHFQTNVKRSHNGRFSVRLPFKDNTAILAESKTMAFKRFISLEKRFARDAQMKSEYSNFINEYSELNHMSIINEDGEDGYYMPHHPVYKRDSLTTQLRVVFDASAPTSSGTSLNDILMKGPTIQRELFDILIDFRFHKFVLTADVEKMYRQVDIHEEDRKYQKILWRKNPDENIQTFCLKTVTYGTTSAPFLAVRCLHQLALDNQREFPHAARVIQRDFYVDDLLTGTQNEEEAKRLQQEITHILRQGCLKLRKWRSNHSSILPATHANEDNYIMPQNKLENSKTLGLIWNSNQDVLKFHNNYKAEGHYTKRIILSSISQIFDPLGLVGPVTTLAKLILQQLWLMRIDWDDPIAQNEHQLWSSLHKQLPLNALNIPRRVTDFTGHESLELHGFCDASERAYGACVYIRTIHKNGIHSVRLLCSKGKVAPLKVLTLPRLELCAALLLSRLISKLMTSISQPIEHVYLWTDSTIVCHWIAATPNTWKTFVANRVSEIQCNTNPTDWRHVSTLENPADIISRGSLPTDLIKNHLWWNGPKWLQEDFTYERSDESYLNSQEQTSCIDAETRKNNAYCLQTNVIDNSIIERYSSLTKLQRIVAYCLRFKNKNSGRLTGTELREALRRLIKLTQSQVFSQEIHTLRRQQPLPKGSKLRSLACFLDKDEVLRVGGRLYKTDLPLDCKHPLALPSSHKLTDLSVLTPSHFLIGESLNSMPELRYRDIPINKITRWNHIQKLYQHLWQRWSTEYLTSLQTRTKWQVHSRNLREGQLVLLKEDNIPPAQWKVGRITEVFPGEDAVVRVVLVKTANSVYKRAVNKICVLPLVDNE